LEVSLGDVIISSMVETIITSTQGSTQTPISTELILWAGLLVPLAVIAAIEIRRIRRST